MADRQAQKKQVTNPEPATKKRKRENEDGDNNKNKKRKVQEAFGAKKGAPLQKNKSPPNLDPPRKRALQKKAKAQNPLDNNNVQSVHNNKNINNSAVVPPKNFDRDEDDNCKDPLPLRPMDQEKKELWNNFEGALATLKDAECTLSNGEKFTLEQICEEWSIQPRPAILSNLQSLPWKVPEAQKNVLSFIEARLIPELAKAIVNFSPQNNLKKDAFAELRGIISKRFGQESPKFQSTFASILPDFVTIVTDWGKKLAIPNNASEMDFTSLYSSLFDPFFPHPSSSRCTAMPLPPPFEEFVQLTDMRAFVEKKGVEWIYFIREDSPAKQVGQPHKDLHKLVQLMRCALRLQILHLKKPKKAGGRTLYCFGMLTSGYCFQLLQMRVIFTAETFNQPTYQLWIEDELDLATIDEDCIKQLLTWIIAIRTYHFALKSSPPASSSYVLDSPRVCMTTTKDLAKTSSTSQGKGTKKKKGKNQNKDDHASAKAEPKKDESDDKDDDDESNRFDPSSNNNNTNQTGSRQALRGEQKSPTRTQDERSKDKGDNDEEVDQETLDAIIYGIDNKEYYVMHENVKYHKRVLLVCTTVRRMRLFVVKIYGNECKNTREIGVLKVLGQHPNICELLAVTKLKTGETLTVQPLYDDSLDWFDDEKRDQFPLVFLQLAKGLAHMHECGIIHGDIKPHNFMVDLEGNTRIIDFDFSARVDTDDMDDLGATEGYMGPEWYDEYCDLTGEEPMSVKTDIWSLAVTMCQYAGVDYKDVTDPLERRNKILDALKKRSFFLWPVRSLIERMLSIREDDRPTASEVFDELVKVYGDRGITRNDVKIDQTADSNAAKDTTATTERVPSLDQESFIRDPVQKDRPKRATKKRKVFEADNDENRDHRSGSKAKHAPGKAAPGKNKRARSRTKSK